MVVVVVVESGKAGGKRQRAQLRGGPYQVYIQ